MCGTACGILRFAEVLRIAVWVENFIAPMATDLRHVHDVGG
jgi:hypothetical protein